MDWSSDQNIWEPNCVSLSRTPMASRGGGDGVMDHRGVAGNSDEPRLRQWAGCPTLFLMSLKPRPNRGMVDVVGPGKSDEDVHVR